MKKTLERLKAIAHSDIEGCSSTFSGLIEIKKTETEKKLFDLLFLNTFNALRSALNYIQALEAYGYELDEEWDKLLKSIEQAREETESFQKDGKKKPSYRV